MLISNSENSNNKSNYTMSTEKKPSLPLPPSSKIHKHTYHEHAVVNTFESSSPTKKARLHAQSSIRKAIEAKGEPRGLLQYFKKATEAEHEAYLDRTTAELKRMPKMSSGKEINMKRSYRLKNVSMPENESESNGGGTSRR